MEVPFTRFPNIFLERFKKDPYGLFFTLVIYRWTIGFRRETYKLTNAKISEESGISPSKIGEIRKRACKKAEIIYTKVKGGYEYKITILPLRKGSITPRKSVVSSEERVDYPQGKISRGAIDNTIDNYKENRILNYFLEKYPKQKSKDHHSILEAYNNLTLDEKDFLEEAIPYQLNNWKINNIAVKYIPKAEIYLNERWSETESNRRHEDFQSSALPTELSDLKNIIAYHMQSKKYEIKLHTKNILFH